MLTFPPDTRFFDVNSVPVAVWGRWCVRAFDDPTVPDGRVFRLTYVIDDGVPLTQEQFFGLRAAEHIRWYERNAELGRPLEAPEP